MKRQPEKLIERDVKLATKMLGAPLACAADAPSSR